MSNLRLLTVLWTMVLILAASLALAEVPQMINYQGRLTDSGGDPVNGPQLIKFKIYGSPGDNDSLWWSGFQAVQVDNGFFDYQLGSMNLLPDDIFSTGTDRWLGITIGVDPEISPRTKMTSMAYAYQTLRSDTSGYATDIADNIVTEVKIAPSEIYSYHIVDGEIQFGDIGQNGAGAGQIMKWNGASWAAADDETGAGAGDITAVYAGNGLTGGAESGDATLDVGGGFGINVSADQVAVDVPALDGTGLNSDGNTLNVEAGTGLQVVGDQVQLTTSYSSGSAYDARFVNEAQANSVTGSMISDETIQFGDIGINAAVANQVMKRNATNSAWIAADDEGLTQAQADDLYVDEDGDTLTGQIAIDFGGDGNLDAVFEEGPGPAGNLELYDNADLKSKLWGEYYGELMLSDDDGDQTVDLSARAGGGGMLELDQEDGSWGMRLRGGSTTDGATLRLYSAGSSPTIVFDADETGDNAADLPINAISRSEVLDEPGVASNTSNINVMLDGTVQTIRSRTITVPASGYILVIGTAEVSCFHFNGTTSRAEFGVSDVAGTFPSNQDVEYYVDPNVGDYTFAHPVTVHGLFSASAGSNTFYFLAEEESGGFMVGNIQFTLVYFPTAYGTVTSTKATDLLGIPDDEPPQGAAMTAEDIAAEKVEAEVFNLARIEREMEEMRIERAKMEERLLKLEKDAERNR